MKRITALLRRFPLISVGVVMAILIGLIYIGSLLQRPLASSAETVDRVVAVRVIEPGKDQAYIPLQAKVESTTSIRVTAQQSGIVRNVSVVEGTRVQAGKQLVSLGTTYSGENVASLQRQLAQTQYSNAVASSETQLAAIATQRQIALLQEENSEQLRELGARSVSDTENALRQNESLVEDITRQIEALSSNPTPDPTVVAQIGQLRGQRAQIESGVVQLRNAYRQSIYQSDEDNAPAELAVLSKDATLRQLELQEKAVVLSKQVSELQLKLAQVQESLFNPVAPGSGVVERVFVTSGQTVNPGAPLFQIKLDKGMSRTRLVALTSQEIARAIDRDINAKFMVDGQELTVPLSYVSSDPTDGFSYSVSAYLDGEGVSLANGSFISMDVALSSTNKDTVLLPIDVMYQSQERSFVYVIENDLAVAKEVVLGEVSGGYVEVSGLSSDQRVILDRNVTEGVKVRVE